MSFVRDGHEQKLELWKQDRQKLQRWQRIQQIGLAASPLTLPAVKVEESAGIEELPKLEVKKQWLSNLTGLWYLELSATQILPTTRSPRFCLLQGRPSQTLHRYEVTPFLLLATGILYNGLPKIWV